MKKTLILNLFSFFLHGVLRRALRGALRSALRVALRSALRGALRSALRTHRNKAFWQFCFRGGYRRFKIRL